MSPTPLRDDISNSRAWSIAVVATLVMAVSFVDRQAFSALAPQITKALGLDPSRYGLLAAAFSISYLVGAPLAGWAVDRTGARRGLIGSVLVWSVVSALHALAPSFGGLFALRIALGAAESPSFPGAAQAIHRVLPPRHRSAGFGMLFCGGSLGAVIAAPLALGFATMFGWRAAFIGTSLFGLTWLPLWLAVTGTSATRRLLSAQSAPAERPPRADASGTSGAGFRELAAAPAGPEPARGLGALLLLLGRPEVRRALLLVLAIAPTLNFVYSWLPQFLVSSYGVSDKSLAGLLTIPPVMFDVGAFSLGTLASWLRKQGPLRAGPRGIVGLSAALCVLMGFTALHPSPGAAVALASIGVFGGGACYALLTADMLARVPPPLVSRAGGLISASQSLAYIVTNIAIGYIVKAKGYPVVHAGLALLVVPGAIAWIVWPIRETE